MKNFPTHLLKANSAKCDDYTRHRRRNVTWSSSSLSLLRLTHEWLMEISITFLLPLIRHNIFMQRLAHRIPLFIYTIIDFYSSAASSDIAGDCESIVKEERDEWSGNVHQVGWHLSSYSSRAVMESLFGFHSLVSSSGIGSRQTFIYSCAYLLISQELCSVMSLNWWVRTTNCWMASLII